MRTTFLRVALSLISFAAIAVISVIPSASLNNIYEYNSSLYSSNLYEPIETAAPASYFAIEQTYTEQAAEIETRARGPPV